MSTQHFARLLGAPGFLIGLVMLGASGGAAAQTGVWTSSGPSGSDIVALAIDPQTPTTVYAGTPAGVFKSTNGGTNWADASTGLTSPRVQTLAIDVQTPSVLYAGTPGGVFKSTDGGASWIALNAGLTTPYVQALAVDPQTPTTIYAGTNGGIFKSTDGALTWHAANTGLSDYNDRNVKALLVDPVTPTTVYAGTWGGLFKSADAAASWTEAGLNAAVSALAIDPSNPNILFAGTWSGFFRSFDRGATWFASNTGLGLYNLVVLSLAVDPQNPNFLYLGVWTDGLYRSFDSGTSWQTAGLARLEVSALGIDPGATTTVYAGTISTGLFKSTDGAFTWFAGNTGMNARVVETLAIDPVAPATLYAGISSGFSVQGGGVRKSSDGGQSWDTASRIYYRGGGTDVLSLAVDPFAPTIVYAGTVGNGVYRSTDGAATWVGITPGRLCDPCSAWAVTIDPTDSSTFYTVLSSWGVYRVTGGIWTRVHDYSTSLNALAVDPLVPAVVYVSTSSGVIKSTDRGATWNQTGLTDTRINTLAIDPQNSLILFAGGPDGTVFKTADAGDTWTSATIGVSLPDVTALAIDRLTPTTVYAGTRGGGVFKSLDGGQSWAPLNDRLANLFVSDLKIDPQTPTTIHAATRAGVFTLRQEASSSNRSPIADAGPDQAVEATGSDGAPVALDGSASFDPDGDPLTYDWSWPGGTATGVRPTVQLPPGTTTVTLVVTDPYAASATDTVQVTVRDTTAPTVAITSPAEGAMISGTVIVTADAADAVGVAAVQFVVDGVGIGGEDTAAPYETAWDTRTASDGNHTVTARARDGAGNVATSSPVTVFVVNALPLPDPAGGSLVAHWALDEGSGTTAGDSSGHGHTGVLLGEPVWTTGQQGSALAFDGLNDSVEVAHMVDLNAYPLTVAAWIKTSSTSGVRGIVNKYVPFSFNGWGLFLNDGNLCAWYLRDTSNYVYPGGGCPFAVSGYNDDQWHHVAFVVDAAGGRLYVDGVSKGSIPWTGTPGPPTTTQAVHLARYPGAYGGAEYFPGLLDEVRIYDHAWSDEEIAEQSTVWRPTGLVGRGVGVLAVDPQNPMIVYAGSGGVFKTTDGGRTWNTSNTGLTQLNVTTLAVDPRTPNIVYAGTRNLPWEDPPTGRLYKSLNGGGNWVDITPPAQLAGPSPVSDVEVDPFITTTIYAATCGDGLWKSFDGGVFWRRLALTPPCISDVAIDPQTSTTLYMSTGSGIAKSTDGGETWIAVGRAGYFNLAVDPQTPTTVYAGGTDYQGSRLFLKTTDGGATWTSVDIGGTSWVSALAIDPRTPTTLYVGTFGDGVFKSTDGATSWTPLNAGLTDLRALSLAIDPETPTNVYAGTYAAGVFKLQQGGSGSPPPGGTSLTAHWALEEGSGTAASDSSGNGHDGTLINEPTWTAGHNGSALAFEGVDDHVEVAHATSLNAYPLTVTAWIKTSSTTGVRGIVNKYVPYSFNGWGLFLNDGNLCAWYLRDSTNYVYPGGGCPFAVPGYNDDQWHHVAFVVDANGGLLYVDGLLNGSIAWTGAPGPPTTTQAIHLARYPGAYGGAEYFPGLLDEVRIYDRALVAEEIAALAGGGS